MAMLRVCRARVIALTRVEAEIVSLAALAEGEETPRSVVAYPRLTGPISVGDSVLLNITATSLGLGTGGVDFVFANESHSESAVFGDPDGSEHIVKLRYTPLQHTIRVAEMGPEPWPDEATLEGTPVVVCGLHSQIAPAAAGIKATLPNARVAYLQTDGAALPLAFSHLVRDLKSAGLVDVTLTAGQAFGGDYECVTNASALLAARYVARANVVIVSQGPGNAGTGTRWGFSGIEQGPLMDLIGALGGQAIGVLRLSLADPRPRHRGLSHHSVTALGRLCARPGTVAFPQGEYGAVREAVMASPIALLHRVETADGNSGLALLSERGVRVTSMGRSPEQDPMFFLAAAAAGNVAAARVLQ